MTNHRPLEETQPIPFPPDLSIYNYLLLIRNLSLPGIVFDHEYKILGVNTAFQRIFQMSLDDLTSLGAKNFFGSESWRVLSNPREESVPNLFDSQYQMIETEFEKNERFYKLTLTAVKNTQSVTTGNLLFFIDMTREKMLEQVRADFTSMIVHDLRSPLTAIMGNLELLFYEFDDTLVDDTRELFQDSLDQSQRLLNMINDLLDVSKIESGKFSLNLEPVSPKEVIEYSVRSMEPLAIREKIVIEMVLEPELSSIMADKDKIIQVLINLISNAIKFTSANGLLQIHSRHVRESSNGKSWLLISISDTGEGIKPDHLSKLFEKYSQVAKTRQRLIKGTGLGLFIVKELMEAHHGDVLVVSEYGKGSCFSLLFPLGDTVDA